MNNRSYNATQCVHEYLAATGDSLTPDVCKSLGLPSGKHYFFDLRHRLESFDNSKYVQNGILSADGPIGSSLSAPAAMKKAIMTLPDDTFTTNQLHHQTLLSKGTMSKALRKLENEGVITRVSASRPCTWRRRLQILPDFTKVFMEVHGLIDPISSVPQGQIAILANRTLCGMPVEGVDIPSIVTNLTSRYARISLPIPPHRALEPFLLAVLKGAGDYRAVTRELEKVFREAKIIRRASERLARKDGSTSPLEDYTLPTEWILIFEQPGRISSFVEAVSVALGSEHHPKEAEWVADEAIKMTITELNNQSIVSRYDASKKVIMDIAPSLHNHVYAILYKSIRQNVKNVDLPVRKFNIKAMYRKVGLEIVQNKIGDSSG
jgi:DNA-binding MarR family transcriptional regulator